MLSFFAALVVFLPIRVHPHSHLACYPSGSSCTKPLPGSVSGVRAISGFELLSRAGDHKIKRIGLRIRGNDLVGTFADDDGKEPAKWFVNWGHYAGRTLPEVSASNCRGTCSLPISRPRAGEHFALSGFEFERLDGGDSNILRVAILPDPARGQLRVVFKDNGDFRYRARVNYGYIAPPSRVQAHRLSGRRGKGQPSIDLPAPQPRASAQVLPGFDVKFDNGDHHLQNFEIVRTTSGARVVFNDANFDDPASATVHLLIVDPLP